MRGETVRGETVRGWKRCAGGNGARWKAVRLSPAAVPLDGASDRLSAGRFDGPGVLGLRRPVGSARAAATPRRPGDSERSAGNGVAGDEAAGDGAQDGGAVVAAFDEVFVGEESAVG